MRNSPKLRIAGFTDAWEQRKLKDIANKVTTKNTETLYVETLTNSAEFGIISQKDFFDHNVSNLDNINGYYIVENNDFVYNPRISVTAPVGPVNRNKLGRAGVMSPLYTVFRTHDVDEEYVEWFFKSSKWHNFMYFNGDTGARADRFAIKDSVFFEMPIPIPHIEEQQKIGAFFLNLDNLITLHQRKCDALKSAKKYFLQNLFPSEGEKFPKLRIDGFTDAWEQRKLGDDVVIISGDAPSKFDKGNELYIKVDDLNYNLKYVTDSQSKVAMHKSIKKVPKGSVIFPKRGAAIITNKVRILAKDSYMDTNMMALFSERIDTEFLYNVISNEGLYKIADTSSVPQINNKHIEPYEVMLPNLDEQRKIGKFFENIDSLITLHQRKCDALKSAKKYFLQNMFI